MVVVLCNSLVLVGLITLLILSTLVEKYLTIRKRLRDASVLAQLNHFEIAHAL